MFKIFVKEIDQTYLSNIKKKKKKNINIKYINPFFH